MNERDTVLRNMMVLEDGKVFSVELIAQNDNPLQLIEDTVKETYTQEITQAKEALKVEFFEQVNNDYREQRQHLSNLLSSSTVSVPVEIQRERQPLVFNAGRVHQAKTGIYAPTVYKLNKNTVERYVGEYTHRQFPEMRRDERLVEYERIKAEIRAKFRTVFPEWDSLGAHLTFTLTIDKVPIELPCVFWIDTISNGTLYANITTFHSMGSYSICIGDNDARRFFDDPMFWARVNTINTFSLGSSLVKDIVGNTAYTISDAVLFSNFVSVSVEERSETTWSV